MPQTHFCLSLNRFREKMGHFCPILLPASHHPLGGRDQRRARPLWAASPGSGPRGRSPSSRKRARRGAARLPLFLSTAPLFFGAGLGGAIARWAMPSAGGLLGGAQTPQTPGELKEKGPTLQQLSCLSLGPFSFNSWGARGALGPSKRPSVKTSPSGRLPHRSPPQRTEVRWTNSAAG
jgi:hypothetical protein